jgi:predicted RNA binding protein YcfA (HicA-like mRNA interferase family)
MKSVSGKDFIRLLESKGWVLLRSRGSHFMYQKAGHPLLIVPVHGNKALRPGLLNCLLKDAGLDEAEL